MSEQPFNPFGKIRDQLRAGCYKPGACPERQRGGEIRWTSGAGMPTDFTFTSQRAGPVNYVGSLMDYIARGYSPTLGRFISADTIVPGAGNPAAFNRYMYVGGNPLRFSDPSGHAASCDESPTLCGGSSDNIVSTFANDCRAKGVCGWYAEAYALMAAANIAEAYGKADANIARQIADDAMSFAQARHHQNGDDYRKLVIDNGAELAFAAPAIAKAAGGVGIAVAGKVADTIRRLGQTGGSRVVWAPGIEVRTSAEPIIAERMLVGKPDKVAVIGRNMEYRVKPFARAIGAETWTGFDRALTVAQNVENNRAWAQQKFKEGYTIIDLGLDGRYVRDGDTSTGQYYAAEVEAIFGK